MQFAYLALAFIGGGVSEALVAFAAHRFHRQHPQPVTLDADMREMLRRHIEAHERAQQEERRRSWWRAEREVWQRWGLTPPDPALTADGNAEPPLDSAA